MPLTPPTLSDVVLGWALTAHYVTAVADDGDVQLRSDVGAPTRYFIRHRGPDRLELTQADDGNDEQPLLFVEQIEVLERYLFALFADDIREDLELPFLDLPWDAHDLAEGFELTDMVRGWRTLTRTGRGPVAAAPDPTLSLLALVPLSHFLGWSLRDLKSSFLSPHGHPLIAGQSYARP